PAPWMMLAGALLAALAIRALYRREVVVPRWRAVLTALRIAAVSLVRLLLARPVLVLRRNHVDRSQVVVLLDRSASMAATDLAPTAAAASQPARVSRWDQAVELLTRQKD